MAQGNTVSDVVSVANGAYANIQPSGTIEWVIHNIYFGGAAEISKYKTSGPAEVIFATPSRAGWYAFQSLHATNAIYLRVKNVSGGTITIGYDGMVQMTS